MRFFGYNEIVASNYADSNNFKIKILNFKPLLGFFLFILLFTFFFPLTGQANNSYYADLDKNSQHYFEITDALQTGLDLTNTDFTIEFWLKTGAIPENFPLSKWDSSGGVGCDYTFYVADDGGSYSLKFWASSDEFACSPDGEVVISGNTPEVWEHFAFVFTQSTTTDELFYKNGIYSTAGSIGFELNNTTASFLISGVSGGSDNFDGSIDEVRIWSHARTSQEIADYYNCGLTGTEDNLISLWNFNNQDGTDETGTNDLTAYNSPDFVGSGLPFLDDCEGGTTPTPTTTPAVYSVPCNFTYASTSDISILYSCTETFYGTNTEPALTVYGYTYVPMIQLLYIVLIGFTCIIVLNFFININKK